MLLKSVVYFLPEDGGRPPKHVGVMIVYFLLLLCTCKLLAFNSEKCVTLWEVSYFVRSVLLCT